METVGGVGGLKRKRGRRGEERKKRERERERREVESEKEIERAEMSAGGWVSEEWAFY